MGKDYLVDDEDGEDGFYDSGNVRDMVDDGIGSNSGLEPDAAIDEMDFEDLLRESRMELLRDLAKAVKQGIATPAEKNTLRQMLKDNGMIMGDPNAGANTPEEKRKADLPRFEPPGYT